MAESVTAGERTEYIGTGIDVTAQRQAQATLHQQARLIALTPAASMMRHLEGPITFWSAGAELALRLRRRLLFFPAAAPGGSFNS